MNCKPGDLAQIVRVGPQTRSCLGKVVRVISIHPKSPPDNTLWIYEPPLPRDQGVEWIEVVEDICLRPINNPGDGATDESKAWLPPVPSTTKEHA